MSTHRLPGADGPRSLSLAGMARAAVVPLLLLAIIFRVWTIVLETRPRTKLWDFNHYYASALALREGINPYTTDLTPIAKRLGLGLREIDRATSTPTFLLSFEPLTLMPYEAAYWTWFGFNLAALAVALMLLLGPLARSSFRGALAVSALAIWYMPVHEHFLFAQTQILILLMLVLMMRWLERGNDLAAGLILAAAGLLRIFPFVLVGYLVVRRRWKALLYTGVGIAAGGVITLALVGFWRSLSFTAALPFVTSRRWLGTAGDVSLDAFVSRFFWYFSGPEISPWTNLARQIVVILASLAVLLLTIKSTIGSQPIGRSDRSFSLWVAAMIMLSTTAWLHYMVLLLIPFALIGCAVKTRSVSRRAVWTSVASYLALFVVPQLTPVHITPLAIVGIGTGFSFALMMAYAATYWFVTDTVQAAGEQAREVVEDGGLAEGAARIQAFPS